MDDVGHRSSERRQVTVLFCDVVDSTGLSERCDLEDLRDVLLEFQALCTQCVEAVGGRVVNYIGDGVRAEFGYPSTSENEAENAVRAGCALLRQLEQLNKRWVARLRESFRVRIGIHTGLAIIGQAAEGHVHNATEIVGDTPNIAARLQEVGEPNTVIISGETQRLLRGRFQLLFRGERSLKGLSRQIQTFQVLGETVQQDVFQRSAHRHAIPMVNRVHELAQLLEAWEAAKSGSGQIVGVSGEAGIGKSRLALELIDRAGLEEDTTVLLQPSVHHQNQPLYPITRWIERKAGLRGEDSADNNRFRLREFMKRSNFAPEEGQHLLIEQLLGFETPAPPGIVDAQDVRRRTRDAVVNLLSSCAHNGTGGLILVEDYHWADPSTIEMVDRLAAKIVKQPVLLLLTSRAALPGNGSHQVRQISLARLKDDECCTLAESVDRNGNLSANLLDKIVDRADGVPLFVEELVAAALETGHLGSQHNGAEAATPEVPSALYDSLMLRLDRLGRAKIVAQQASVLGRSFSNQLLAAIVTDDRSSLESSLQRLLDAGLLRREANADGTSYSFKHALVRDVAYHSLLKRQRREIHGRIADRIETDLPSIAASEPAYLAQHLSEAGRSASAARMWLKAGQQSAARSANLEALAQLRAALDEVGKLPPGPGRDDLELSAQIALIAPTIAVYGFAANPVAEVSTRAIELCRALNEDPRIFPALYARWSHLRVAGYVSGAEALASEFLSLAERTGTRTDRMVGHRLLGTSLIDKETERACEHLEKAIALHDPVRDRLTAAVYGTDVHISSLSNLSIGYWLLGRVTEGLECGQRALTLAIELRHAHTLGYAFALGCMLHALERDVPTVKSLADQMLTAATKRELPLWISVSRAFLGWCEVEAGHLASGIEMLERERGFLRVAQVAYWLPMYLGWLAEAHADLGNLDRAKACVDEARAVSGDSSFWYEIECLRIEGRIADGAHALECFERAIALAQRRGQWAFALRSAHSFASYLMKNGQPERARSLLEEAMLPFASQPVRGDRAEAIDLIRSLT